MEWKFNKIHQILLKISSKISEPRIISTFISVELEPVSVFQYKDTMFLHLEPNMAE